MKRLEEKNQAKTKRYGKNMFFFRFLFVFKIFCVCFCGGFLGEKSKSPGMFGSMSFVSGVLKNILGFVYLS